MIKILKFIKDIVDPGYWSNKIDKKFGLYDKAKKSSIRKWALELDGWKWWAWQIVVGGIGILIFEFLLKLIGLSMLPWRW